MNFYEHTIIARQDTSPNQLKQLQEKYTTLVSKNDGKVVKTENWGLLNLSYLIKKNRKGNYIHFKIEGSGKTINELERNEKIDKNLLRYLTVKVKKLDLKTKQLVLEFLWEIILSDDKSDVYESTLMRRICGLLYLPDKLSGEIKSNILKRKKI